MKALTAIFLMVLMLPISVSGQDNNSNTNLFELLDRLQQLQTELQQLRGTVEEQNYKISTLEKSQEAMALDFEQRLRTSTTPAGMRTDSNAATMAADIDQSSDAFVGSSSATAIKPLPQPLDQAAAPVQMPQAMTQVQQAAPQSRTLYKRSTTEEKQAYQQAYEMLRTGGTVQSITLFKQFLQDYPRGEYADNASYWLAEAYKLNQQTDLARLTFQSIVNEFANSPKVPDAKLKLAFIEAEQNNLVQARQLLNEITTDYPGSSVAYLAAKKLVEIRRY